MTSAYLTHKSFTMHDFPRHPENAARIRAVWEELAKQALLEQLLHIAPAKATDEQICAVHSPVLLDHLRAVSQQDRRVRVNNETYAVPQSLEAARYAAGAVIGAVDAVATGRSDNALAIVRPPGHHATSNRQMGFCLLNNIAIAARHAQTQHPIEKVLILDYDVHHGNGTQAIFYADPSVMFISLHESPLYPGSGALNEIGTGAGSGYTLNVPLSGGHGDASYRQIFAEIVWSAAERFEPDLMLISAGFDAHWVDPLSSAQLTLGGYDHLARACLEMAATFCGGKVVFVMEGGYDTEALAHGWCNIARVLLGIDEISDPYGYPPDPAGLTSVQPLINKARRIHQL